MSSEDPYAAPGAAVSDPAYPGNRIRWKRIVGWGALICATIVSTYMISGIIHARLRFYGFSIEEIAASIASFVLYLVFLHATSHRHLLQLTCVFLIVQIFGIAIGGAFGLLIMLAVGGSASDLISFAELGRNLLVCLLAYAAWYSTARKPVMQRV